MITGRVRRMTVAAALFTALATSVLAAPSASAERDDVFTVDNKGVGDFIFGWADGNTDNVATALHFVGCSANPDIRLVKRNADGSYSQYGETKRIWCLNTDGGWHGWGDVPAGVYQYQIVNPRSANHRLDVNYAHAVW